MFGKTGGKISTLLNREKRTEAIQSEIRNNLNENHPEPQKAKNAIASYNKELNNLENEIDILDSTNIVSREGEIFRESKNLLERTVEVMEDISEIEILIEKWIEVLSPIENGEKPDFQRSHEITVELKTILDNLPESDSGSTQLLENIEEVVNALERIFNEAQEAKKELQRIEELNNSELDPEESELQRLFEELQSIKTVKRKAEKLKEEKEKVQKKAEAAGKNLESIDNLKSQLDRLSNLLHKTPEAIFRFEGVDEDLRMSQLRKSFRVKERLNAIPDLLEGVRPGHMTRRELLKSYGKFYATYATLASSGLYSYLTYQNVKSIDQSGGGKEVFFSGGEEKSYQHDNAIETVISGGSVPVNIIHVRIKDEQPSYSKKEFEDSVQYPFAEDLDIRIEPKFLELDLREANIGGSKEFQEQRQTLAKLISKTKIMGGIDEEYFSSTEVKEDLAREIYSRIFAFDKISENMVYGSSESNPNISLVVSDFKEGSYSGVAAAGISRNLALAQDLKNQQVTEAVVVHELGHKFGLPHTATPQDVMSYSSLSTILEKAGRPYFSWESKYNWWKKKNTYRKREKIN